MARIKLTIQELKHQQDNLKRYRRFLPTLMLKKLQLQIEYNNIRHAVEQKREEIRELREAMETWMPVLGEDRGLADLVRLEEVQTAPANIAGVDIEVLKGVRFRETGYDLYVTPPWVDRAVSELKRILSLRAEVEILEAQADVLAQELRTTIQRVNLFEKIKIPESAENIRRIRIFLGDQQTAGVVRGKLAKEKVSRRVAAAGVRNGEAP